jgi:hypothetical protein
LDKTKWDSPGSPKKKKNRNRVSRKKLTINV